MAKKAKRTGWFLLALFMTPFVVFLSDAQADRLLALAGR